MTDEEILERLTSIVRTLFDDDTLAPTADMGPGDIKGWNSLNHVRLLLAIEQAFNIRFSSKEAGQTKRVGAIIAMIQQKTGG